MINKIIEIIDRNRKQSISLSTTTATSDLEKKYLKQMYDVLSAESEFLKKKLSEKYEEISNDNSFSVFLDLYLDNKIMGYINNRKKIKDDTSEEMYILNKKISFYSMVNSDIKHEVISEIIKNDH